MTYYKHWRGVSKEAWRWPNFSPAEIACRGTGKVLVNEKAMDALQTLRDRLGCPIILTSAYRSPEHNRAVGGAPRSKHLDGTAFDIRMDNHDPGFFEAAARECGFSGFGYYPQKGFLHIDLGPERRWGKPFPALVSLNNTGRFTAEAIPKSLVKSKTMAGAGVAGLATVLQALASGIVGSAEEYLPRAKQAAELAGSVIPSWTPYVFAVIALAGVVVVAYARVRDQSKIGVSGDEADATLAGDLR